MFLQGGESVPWFPINLLTGGKKADYLTVTGLRRLEKLLSGDVLAEALRRYS